jgi:hypothetical protein
MDGSPYRDKKVVGVFVRFVRRLKKQQQEQTCQILGLDSYFQFCKWMPLVELPDESVDVLWCDFGVGSRMKILPPVPG